MISARQMAAARALLSWTQEQLADVSGTSPNTIYKFEKGESISFDKLQSIRGALESKGIEFIGKDGVLRRSGCVRTFEGTSGSELFYEDLLSTVKVEGGVVAATFDTQETMANCLGVTSGHYLGRLEQLGRFAEVNCLLSNTQDALMLIPSFQFRVISRNPAYPFFSIIYGDKVAVIATDGMDFTYMVIQSVIISQKGLKTFEADWNAAFPFAISAHPQAQFAV